MWDMHSLSADKTFSLHSVVHGSVERYYIKVVVTDAGDLTPAPTVNGETVSPYAVTADGEAWDGLLTGTGTDFGIPAGLTGFYNTTRKEIIIFGIGDIGAVTGIREYGGSAANV